MFAVSENIGMFVLPNIANRTDSRITYSTADKAGFLFDDSTLVDSRCLATLGDSASFVTYLPQVFRTMPNTENLNANAQGASASTACPRHKAYSTLKSEEQSFKVAVFGYVFSGNQGFGHRISYVVSAPSEASAIAKATRIYSRRPNALRVLEVRIIHPANSTCLTFSNDER